MKLKRVFSICFVISFLLSSYLFASINFNEDNLSLKVPASESFELLHYDYQAAVRAFNQEKPTIFSQEAIPAIKGFFEPNPIGLLPHPNVKIWDGVEPFDSLLKREPGKEQIILFGEPDDTGTVKNLGRPGDNDPNVVLRKFFQMFLSEERHSHLEVIYLGNILPVNPDSQKHPVIRPHEFGDTYFDTVGESHQRVKEVISQLLAINPDLKLLIAGGDNGYSYANFAVFPGVKGLLSLDNHHDAKTTNPRKSNNPIYHNPRLPGPHSGTWVTQLLEDPVYPLDAKYLRIIGFDKNTGHTKHRLPWLYNRGISPEQIHPIEKIIEYEKSEQIKSFLKEQMRHLFLHTDHWQAMFDIDTLDVRIAPGRSAIRNSIGDLKNQKKGISPDTALLFSYYAGLYGASVFDVMEVAPRYDNEVGMTSFLAAQAMTFYLKGLDDQISKGSLVPSGTQSYQSS